MEIGRLLKKQTPRRRKVLLGLLIVLVLASIMVAAGRIINSSAIGAIKSDGTTSPQITEPKALAMNKQYDGKYISFTYPPDYQAGYSSPSGSYLEVYRFYSSNHSGQLITISVIRESIENDSGALYRQNHPEIYKQQTGLPSSLIFLSRQNGFERTAFIAHADLVASISAMDPGGHDITDVLNIVANSLVWK